MDEDKLPRPRNLGPIRVKEPGTRFTGCCVGVQGRIKKNGTRNRAPDVGRWTTEDFRSHGNAALLELRELAQHGIKEMERGIRSVGGGSLLPSRNLGRTRV